MRTQVTGVSRRAYARMRGVSEATIRKHLTNGNLADALLPDGTLNPEKADRLLPSSIPQGVIQPVTLEAAKVRRLRAQVRRLNDQVHKLRLRLIRPDDAAKFLGESNLLIAGHLRALPERIASVVAGIKGQAAHLALRDAVYAALEAISSEPISGRPTEDEELQLNGWSYASLLAMRTDLQGEELELERAVAKGHLRYVHEIIEEYEERMAVSKSLLLAIPGRVGPMVEHETVEQVRMMLAEEIEQAIAVLE